MDDRQRMQHGDLYRCADPQILKVQRQAMQAMYEYNATRSDEMTKRRHLLEKMFAQVGPDTYVEPPLHANWGGAHVYLGRGIYLNFNTTLVDDGEIHIGDHTLFGPNVTLATAAHPIWPTLRLRGYQYNVPIVIGQNCWLGAGVTVLPGVHIGDNTVVGAGSLVTRDLPANVVAYGSPAKVHRQINEHDREYYFRQRRINWDSIPPKGIE